MYVRLKNLAHQHQSISTCKFTSLRLPQWHNLSSGIVVLLLKSVKVSHIVIQMLLCKSEHIWTTTWLLFFWMIIIKEALRLEVWSYTVWHHLCRVRWPIYMALHPILKMQSVQVSWLLMQCKSGFSHTEIRIIHCVICCSLILYSAHHFDLQVHSTLIASMA